MMRTDLIENLGRLLGGGDSCPQEKRDSNQQSIASWREYSHDRIIIFPCDAFKFPFCHEPGSKAEERHTRGLGSLAARPKCDSLPAGEGKEFQFRWYDVRGALLVRR